MSIESVTTMGFGIDSGFSGSASLVVTMGYLEGDAPPPVVTTVIGGAGHPWRRLRHRKSIKEQVREYFDLSLREIYERSIAQPATAEAAAEAVQEHTRSRAEVPPASRVDWDEMERDLRAAQALVTAYQERLALEAKRLDDEIEAEDEEILFGLRRRH